MKIFKVNLLFIPQSLPYAQPGQFLKHPKSTYLIFQEQRAWVIISVISFSYSQYATHSFPSKIISFPSLFAPDSHYKYIENHL